MRWLFSTASRWVITMNTSIEGLPSEAAAGAAIEAASEAGRGFDPAGLPSAEVLTRLANDMFARLPGGGLNPGGAPVITPEAAAAVSSPTAQILPRTPLPAAPYKSVDLPLGGAPGANSNVKPSAHGAPLARPLPPSPSAASFPGEAELRALLKDRISSPASAQPLAPESPGQELSALPAAPIAAPKSPVDVPFADAPGVDSNFAPSAHGALVSRPPPSPIAIALPGEAELRALLSERVPSPAFVPGLPSQALPAQPRPAPLSHGATVAAPGSSYYFLDESRYPRAKKATSAPHEPQPGYDVLAVRRDFPILDQRIHGHTLIWLDNAATTQKPQAVIDRLVHFYSHENSNVHRGAHELAARATDAYEDAREKVRGFLGASSSDEIVFVRGATEAINLVAQSFGRQNIGEGDEIVITWLEHHANIVPWQQLATETGAVLKVVPVDDRGQVRLDAYEKLLGPRTKLVSFTEVSNALGTVTPAKQMVEMAHRYGALVLIDGAQAVSHMRVDVQELNCDFYVFSGHKVFAPTGIGALWGRKELLDAMPPWQGGGNMIRDVTFERTEYHDAPGRFEAGTGNIADAVGLGAAIDYLSRIGMETIARHEQGLIAYATKLLLDVPGLRIVGTAAEKAGVISFVLDGKESEAVGSALNRHGIAVRSGHHCAQPILRRFGLESTVRPSFALYNTYADIDALIAALHRIQSGANPV
jgi:cysteine desulfurase / selenocysteine lyase